MPEALWREERASCGTAWRFDPFRQVPGPPGLRAQLSRFKGENRRTISLGPSRSRASACIKPMSALGRCCRSVVEVYLRLVRFTPMRGSSLAKHTGPSLAMCGRLPIGRCIPKKLTGAERCSRHFLLGAGLLCARSRPEAKKYIQHPQCRPIWDRMAEYSALPVAFQSI